MIWAGAKVWAIGAVCAVALTYAGTREFQIHRLRGQLSAEKLERAEERQAALSASLAEAVRLDSVADQLIKTQGERDAALKRIAPRVRDYNAQPGASAVCFDDPGLRIIADLARGAAGSAGVPAGEVPARTSGAD